MKIVEKKKKSLTFLESLHRADYTKVFFDIFVAYVQKKGEKNTTWILKIDSSAS